MAEEFKPVTQSFSAGYELVHNADVVTHDGNAIMDEQMLDSLRERFGYPVIGYVGGLHYQFKPSNAILSGTLAVPDWNHQNPDELLIQK
jgi:hypothetical protein